MVFDAAKAVYERGQVAAAHPDFVRLLTMVKPSASPNQPLWNHDNAGDPGIAGADVAARAAWTITRGRADVRVAVLDEGVDTEHPALKAAIVDQKDFVDGNAHARPDGNDAHGTACAGIIVSRDATYPGLAPECSLVAVRIAKGDGTGNWIFDDFATADAIDWAWQEGKADVLSNSWGGGPAVDVVSRAIERARTKGRQGRGAVVVFAAGNDNGPVNFPADDRPRSSRSGPRTSGTSASRPRRATARTGGEAISASPSTCWPRECGSRRPISTGRRAIAPAISRSLSTALRRRRRTWRPRRP